MKNEKQTTGGTPWYTLNEAANHLRVSQKTLQRAMRSGQLEYERVGGKKIIIHKKMLYAFVKGFPSVMSKRQQRTLQRLMEGGENE